MRLPMVNKATTMTTAFISTMSRRLALGLALAGAAAGCNWTTFADDASKAPVRSIGQPSSFKTNDFGQVLLPLLDGEGKSAAFAASSVNETNVSILKIDAGGGVSNAQLSPLALNILEDAPVTSMVEVPGTNPPLLLLGTPILHQNQTYGRVFQMLIPDGVAQEITIPALTPGGIPMEPGLGRGVTVGRLAGVEATYDYVIASDDHVAVLVDGSANTAAVSFAPTSPAGCDLSNDLTQLPRYLLKKGLVAARLWPDPAGPTVQQLVVGATHASAPAVVSFVGVVADGAGGYALNCIATAAAPATSPTAVRSHFGQALATGDFDADGNVDLLIGAPGQQAFAYFGPFTGGAVPAPVAITDAEGVDFGYSVATLNVDGLPGDEALIGDPSATVGGHSNAGRVRAYKIDKTTGTAVEVAGSPYGDHSPESDARYGTSVVAQSFCTAAPATDTVTSCPPAMTSRILMVGSNNEVFAYFRVGDNLPPRAMGGKTVGDVRAP